jgi:Ca2+-binding EF-hand superfamily protein
VLFQIKLKIWDEPLDYRRFGQAIRLLDSSFSESQLKVLFSKLKNADGRVDIQVFLSNVTGAKEDTVDYRNTMFKRLYNDVYQGGKSQALLRLLEQNDKKSDGKISP